MSLVLIIFALLSGVVFPLYALVTAKKTQAAILESPEILAQAYKSIIFTQWAMTLPVVVILALEDGGFISIGIHFLTNPLSILGLIVTVIVGAQLVKILPYPEKRLIKPKTVLRRSYSFCLKINQSINGVFGFPLPQGSVKRFCSGGFFISWYWSTLR